MHNRLKTEILAQYRSIHAFCKAHSEISRGTVYLVCSGKYAGNFDNQAKKIRKALAGESINDAASRPGKPAFSQDAIRQSLQEIRCQNCRRLNRRECQPCMAQTETEASQLFDKLFTTD